EKIRAPEKSRTPIPKLMSFFPASPGLRLCCAGNGAAYLAVGGRGLGLSLQPQPPLHFKNPEADLWFPKRFPAGIQLDRTGRRTADWFAVIKAQHILIFEQQRTHQKPCREHRRRRAHSGQRVLRGSGPEREPNLGRFVKELLYP